MDEQVIKFRVGVVLLAAGVVTAILVVIFSTLPDLFTPTYSLNIVFPSASGVMVNTPVRKNGVPIGRVTHVELKDDPEEDGVLLRLRIDEKFRLIQRDQCRIKLRSLVTGDSVLEFVRLTRQDQLLKQFDADRNGRLDDEEKARSLEVLTDGMTLRNGEQETGPLEVMVNLESQMAGTFDSIRVAGEGVQEAGKEITTLVRSLNNVIGDNEQQITRILEKAELALNGFQKAMQTVDDLVGDPELKQSIKQALADLPKVLTDARTTLTRAQETLAGFQRVGARAEANLANLERVTKPLGERGDRLARDLTSSLANLETLLGEFAKFSQSLNNNKGSLGRLLNDDELYQRLNLAAVNIEQSSRRLRPILEDVRIFTDKIAADPRILGVKGAINRRPAGTGLKHPLR